MTTAIRITKGGGFGNTFVLIFVNADPLIGEKTFNLQLFDYNLYMILIPVVFLLFSIFLFKEEDIFLFTRNDSTLKNLKILLTNWESIKIIIAVSFVNGLMILIGSTINIIASDHKIDNDLASLIVLSAVVCGLISSILYTVIFNEKKNHAVNMGVLSILTALSVLGGGFSIYYDNEIGFSVCFSLVGVFGFPAIPFLMEKHSMDFENVSLNIINMSKFGFYF